MFSSLHFSSSSFFLFTFLYNFSMRLQLVVYYYKNNLI
nr:MAG TPA: hypothetical protein [Caudoviricetes sp.]